MDTKELLAKHFDIVFNDDEEINDETLTKKRDEKWIGKASVFDNEEIVSKITGKRMGSVATRIAQFAKEHEFELPEDFKKKSVEEQIELLSGKSKEKFEAISSKVNDSNDKKLQDALKELDKYKGEVNTFKELNTNLSKELESRKENAVKERRNFILNHKVSQIKNSIPFSENATPLLKKGFDSHLAETYDIQLSDDEESIVVLDKKTGQPVKNETGTKLLSFDEVLKKEAATHGLLKQAAGTSGAAGGQTQQRQQQQNNNNDKPRFTIAPQALNAG